MTDVTIPASIMPSADWIWGGVTACAWAVLVWVFRLWHKASDLEAEKKFEPKRDQSEEAQRQRRNAIAREVLSSAILAEFADSTTTAAFQSPRCRASVESIVADSIPIQRVIDQRVQHGWNNHQYELDKMVRDRIAEGNKPILEAIKELSETMVEFRVHCAAQSAKEAA